jgi:LysR family hydrogen peroxide-inducible transcriptional activator
MPTLRQLEYLLAVADTLHFRRASERVNTTQPTLSEQLKALEDRLGAQLVERNRSRVVLTPVGVEVVDIARRMLRDAQEIRAITQRHGGTLAGVVRLGVSPTVGAYMLSRVIPVLHKRFPDLRLHVRESLPQTLSRGLDEGTFDLIITPLPIRGADFEVETLFREPLHVAMATDHPLAARANLGRADLAGAEVLTLGPGYHLHDIVAQLCEEVGARVRYDYEGTSLDTLREMVATGLGLSFLPGLYVRTAVARDPSVRTALVQGLDAHRTVGMAWRRTTARRSSFKQIAELCRTTIERELSTEFEAA